MNKILLILALAVPASALATSDADQAQAASLRQEISDLSKKEASLGKTLSIGNTNLALAGKEPSQAHVQLSQKWTDMMDKLTKLEKEYKSLTGKSPYAD